MRALRDPSSCPKLSRLRLELCSRAALVRITAAPAERPTACTSSVPALAAGVAAIRVPQCSFMCTTPNVMTLPLCTTPRGTRTPSILLPLLDPRSINVQPCSVREKRACSRETLASSMRMSARPLRPRTWVSARFSVSPLRGPERKVMESTCSSVERPRSVRKGGYHAPRGNCISRS